MADIEFPISNHLSQELLDRFEALTPTRVDEIVEAMDSIKGYLTYNEGLALFASALAVSCPDHPPVIVEIGSFQGRSTTVLALAARQTGGVVFAIDPHSGKRAGSRGIPDTFKLFQENLYARSLEQMVRPIRLFSTEVTWQGEIDFLFIDGGHQYEEVSQDFNHFSSFIRQGGLLAFHDYGAYGIPNSFGYGRTIDFSPWPGVTRCVDEILQAGLFTQWSHVDSLITLVKR